MTSTALGHLGQQLEPRLPAFARFSDAVVLVTGAASGIGATAATLFASEGALVVAADASSDQRVVDNIARTGGSAFCIQEDLTRPDSGRLLVGDVLEIYGRLDVLIHTGAGPEPEGSRNGTPAFLRVQDNLQAGYRIARAALPAMSRCGGGSMLFTSTISGGPDVEARQREATQAQHPGFLSLIRTLASRYAAAGIRVNGVHPIHTGDIQPAGNDAGPMSSRAAVDAESAAATLALLASPRARSTTGQIVTADPLDGQPGHGHHRRSPPL